MVVRVIIGIDTEYEERRPDAPRGHPLWGKPNPSPPKPRKGKKTSRAQRARLPYNALQAYSYHLIDMDTGAEIGDVITPKSPEYWADRRNRQTLPGFIAACIKHAVDNGVIPAADDYEITVACHFTAADLPAFRDFGALMKGGKLTALRKTYASVGLQQTIFRTLQIPGVGHRVKMRIAIRDTMLIAPAAMRSLAAVGDAIGVPKLKVSKADITQISMLRQRDPKLFYDYALRDAVIAARFSNQMRLFARDTLGLNDAVPVTLSSVGVAAMEAELQRHGVTFEALTGKNKKGVAVPGQVATEGIAVNAYSGGRNECFHVGPTLPNVPLYDVDLSGAYPAGMASIRTPDWMNARACDDLDTLAQTGDLGMTFACVEYTFPRSCRFPSLPTRDTNNPDAGLFYPRRRTSYATGSEILVALNAGAKVKVLHGVLIPWADDFRPFLETSRMFAAIRSANKGAALEGKQDDERLMMALIEKSAKEAANSIYGQLARAVAGMRADARAIKTLNLQTGDREELPPSRISSPALAAWTTGYCRAAVGELLHRLPSDAHVISVTTDGLLSSIPLGLLDTSGPMMRAFIEQRRLLDPDDPPLTVKHTCQRAYSIRTRGVLTIEGDRTEQPLFARAGNRVSEDQKTMLLETHDIPKDRAWAENDIWLDHAKTRGYGTKNNRPKFLTQAEQWRLNGADLTKMLVEVRVAMDFDFKRRLTKPVTEWCGCFGAGSEPWETIEDAQRQRDTFDRWRKGNARVLRTADDLRDLNAYAKANNTTARGRTANAGNFAASVRRAVACGMWGFPPLKSGRGKPARDDWTERRAAAFLTDNGVKTSRDQMKRARAAGPPEHDYSTDPRIKRLQSVVAEGEKTVSPDQSARPIEINHRKQSDNGETV